MSKITNMKHATFFVVAFLMLSCNDRKSGPTIYKNRIQRVKVSSPKKIDQLITASATGVLTSSSEIKLSFKVGGIVQSINIRPGETVEQGQVLARINQSEARANYDKAQEALEKSKRDLYRAESLYLDSSATLEQLQNAKTSVQIAQSDFEIAAYNFKHAKIISPVSGTVLGLYAEVGELVAAGNPIISIGKSNEAGTQVLRASVADKDLFKIILGDTASITFSALPTKTYEGRITEIAQAPNALTGTYSVEITLIKGYYPELRNGFVGKVDFFARPTDGLVNVPIKAMVEGEGKKTSLFITKDHKTAQIRTVHIVSFQEDAFTIYADELPENAKIITDGSQYLSPNDSIEIQNP